MKQAVFSYWRAGFGTYDIARYVGEKECDVYNYLSAEREKKYASKLLVNNE
jgi:hypothetical protein